MDLTNKFWDIDSYGLKRVNKEDLMIVWRTP